MKNIQTLIEYLQGTCKGFHEACEELGINELELTSDDLQEIDDQIFQCDTCGWWCEVCEEVETYEGEHICQDCKDEN